MAPRLFIALALLASPAAAFAAGAASVPEGSQATLFALALLGIVVGRRASMRKPGDDPKQD